MEVFDILWAILKHANAASWAQAVFSAAAVLVVGLYAGQPVLRQYRLEQSRRVWTLLGLVKEARRLSCALLLDVRIARRRKGATDFDDARMDRLLQYFQNTAPEDFGTSSAIRPYMAAREILVEISRRAANQYLAQSKTARTEALAYVADLRRQEKALLKLAIDAHRESRKFWLT